jgi:hypothetical protein
MINIYVGRASTKSIPFDAASFSYKEHVYNPNTVSFKTTVSLNHGTDIRVTGYFETFGGQIVDKKEDYGIYSYTAYHYQKLLNGKVRNSFSKKTGQYIIKKILKDRGLQTGGISKTTKKHDYLVFKDIPAIDVCHQIVNLEKNNMEFYVNHNGIGVLKKIPQSYRGVRFQPGLYGDSSVNSSTANIITGIKVYGKNNSNSLLYSYKNKALTTKFGSIIELIMDDKITTKAKAKFEAKKLWKKRGRSELEATINIPLISDYKKLKPGHYCLFYDTHGKLRQLFIEEITNTSTNRHLKLMSSKTPQPDSWTYKAPESSSTTSNTTCKTSVKTVTNPKPTQGSCAYCKPFPAKTMTFENYCPRCGKKGKLKWNYGHSGKYKYNYSYHNAPEGMWTCDPNNGGCGADYCAKCGSEKMVPRKGILKRSASNSCNVSGIPAEIVKKARELGSAKKIFNWVDKNIKYKVIYYDDKQTDLQVFRRRNGNCVDQSQLLISMLKCIGVSAKMNPSSICGEYSHRNITAKVNGRNILMDTTCSKPSNRTTGAWIKRYKDR